MVDERKRTIVLGAAFLLLLLFSSFENTVFFGTTISILQNLSESLQNQLLAIGILFIHNILVVSLILLGMTFYVNLVVLNFFKREKHANIVLEHPQTFAIVFALMIIFLSILRGSTIISGGIILETLPLVLLISAPVGIVEGYGIYLTINKTLSRTMTTKNLVYIYCIFLIAAIIEVGFINLLIQVNMIKP